MGHQQNGEKNSKIKWVSIVGARPQFVKLAPVCRAIREHNRSSVGARIEHRIVHSGQHYDREIADVFFESLGIPEPICNLGVGSGSHAVQLAKTMERLEPVLSAENPDWVIVYGDTNSTLAGALVAARLHLPVAHVEAGCRCYDMQMPEEQNRVVVDHLSQLLLAPSRSAINNLHREGIGAPDDTRPRRAAFVGDVMYDVLIQNMDTVDDVAREVLHRLQLRSGGYYLLTLHRAETTQNPETLKLVLDTAAALDLPVVFPQHPRTKAFLKANGIAVPDPIRLLRPVPYLEMMALVRNARKVLTDSGGLQKEAFYLGVPCVTLRQVTEWSETVELRANRLVGLCPEKIFEAVRSGEEFSSRASEVYGDGRSAQAIVRELLAGVEVFVGAEAGPALDDSMVKSEFH